MPEAGRGEHPACPGWDSRQCKESLTCPGGWDCWPECEEEVPNPHPSPGAGTRPEGTGSALPSALPSAVPAPPPHVLKHLFCFSVLEHVTQQFESCLVKHRRPFYGWAGPQPFGSPPSAWHGQELEQGPSACSLNE